MQAGDGRAHAGPEGQSQRLGRALGDVGHQRHRPLGAGGVERGEKRIDVAPDPRTHHPAPEGFAVERDEVDGAGPFERQLGVVLDAQVKPHHGARAVDV